MDASGQWSQSAIVASRNADFVYLAARIDDRGRTQTILAQRWDQQVATSKVVALSPSRKLAAAGVVALPENAFWRQLAAWLAEGAIPVAYDLARLGRAMTPFMPAGVLSTWRRSTRVDLHAAARLLDREVPLGDLSLAGLAVRANIVLPEQQSLLEELAAVSIVWGRALRPTIYDRWGARQQDDDLESKALVAPASRAGTAAPKSAVVGAAETTSGVIIPAAWLPRVQRDIEKIVRKASRHGFPAPRLVVGEEALVSWPPGSGSKRLVKSVSVILELDAPVRLGGWRFVARLENPGRKMAANIVLKVPGVTDDVPQEFRFVPADRCQHCGLSRPRLASYLVRNEAGEYRQVGRNCLEDFTGHAPEAILRYIATLSSAMPDPELIANEGQERYGRAEFFYPIAETIRLASRVVVVAGYVSRANATLSRPATADIVREWLDELQAGLRGVTSFAKQYPDSKAAQDLNEATISSLSDLSDGRQLNDFELNMLSLWLAGVHTARQTGIAVASVWRGQHDLEGNAKGAAAAFPDSTFIGRPDERLRGLIVSVLHVRSAESAFGARMRVYGRSVGGEQIAWWGQARDDIDVGASVRLDGTVRSQEHDRYNGQPLTELFRVRIHDVLAAP